MNQTLPAFDTQRLDRAGRLIDVSMLIVPLRDLRGVFAGLALSMRDIRPSKQAERDIQQLNAALQERAVALKTALTDVQSTLHAVPALISYWNAASVLVRGNLAWHRQFGAALAAHPGLRCTDLFEPLHPQFGRCVAAALAGRHALRHMPFSDVGANGPAPDAPHSTVSHNINTPNTSIPQNLMPGPSDAQRRPEHTCIYSIRHIRAQKP